MPEREFRGVRTFGCRDIWPRRSSSQPLSPLRSDQLAVERGKWGMSGGAGNLQDHAIGEIATGTSAIEFEGGRDDVALLHDEMFLIEQYFDRRRYLRSNSYTESRTQATSTRTR